jgi:hypothetical protein
LFKHAHPNLASTKFYNRVHKVSKEKLANYLKSMAVMVGIDPDYFTDRIGRAMLITCMAFLGVLD